jgi:thioredoxin-dependent peroxiredoxin
MKAIHLTLLALAACTPASPAPADPATASAPASGAASTPSPVSPPLTAGAALAASSSAAAPAPVAASTDPLVGQPAPDFTATAQDGSSVHIAALSGKKVVVYFYPKDETPGCTKEACSFRDAWTALGKTGAVLVGVSADSLDSHKAFVSHYKLPFLLVSDPDGSIGKKYGVPFEGHHQRQTIVIGADGKVVKVYRKVDVTVHAQEILADLAAG